VIGPRAGEKNFLLQTDAVGTKKGRTKSLQEEEVHDDKELDLN